MFWPGWAFVVVPIMAAFAVAAWFLFPRLQRNRLLRFALILSLALTGLEVVVLVFFWTAFTLFTQNGPIEFD